MAKFTIEFEPPLLLDSAAHGYTSIDFEVGFELYNMKPLNLLFSIEDERYGYHPAAPIVLLDDLEHELQMLKSRISHPVKLSDYPVLSAEIDREHVSFSCPQTQAANPERNQPGGTFPVTEVEKEVDRAIAALRHHIARETACRTRE